MGVVQRVVGVALVTAVLLAGTVAVGPAARGDSGQEAELFDLLNGYRASRGVAPLRSDAQLASVARTWAGRMMAAGVLSHNPSLGAQVTADWEKVAEIVGAGPGAAEVQQAFMNSGLHSSKMLDPQLTHAGIGAVTGPDGKLWVVEDFMRLAGGGGAEPAPSTTSTTRAPRATTTTSAAPGAVRSAVPAAPAPPPAPPRPRPRPKPVAVAAPPPEPAPSPPPPAPPARLALVLEQLRALDAR